MNYNVGYAILRAISYFHVFKYPLREEEIWKYLTLTCTKDVFTQTLAALTLEGILFKFEDYYSVVNDASLCHRRDAGYDLAQQRLKKAMRISRFLGNFPFVNSIYISGSLSKDFALPDSDLDFFIVADADRLWIARSLMHIFKKFTFIAGAQHSFCMNYYLSTSHLEVSPKSIFTAIELATLKPAYIGDSTNALFLHNERWVKMLLPNADFNITAKPENKKLAISRAFEHLIDRLGGERINSFLYRFTLNKWLKKWQRKKYDMDICKTALGYNFNTPVNFPKNYPDKILAAYEQIFKEYKKQMDDKLAMAGSGTLKAIV